MAPRPLSREAPAIWVTVPASENKGASGRGRGEKGESICLTVWRQSMLTSQQLRCTDWLCMSAIPSSQSEEWVGYSPNPKSFSQFAARWIILIVRKILLMMITGQVIKSERKCCTAPRSKLIPCNSHPPHPAASLSKYYEGKMQL